jgi:hypothetical protein
MMSDALASRLAVGRRRRVGSLTVRRPVAPAARARPGGIKRLARRIGRHLPARRSSTARMPRGGFELEAAHRLTTAQLWGVWTVAHLESGLALRAWRVAPREHRGRAYGSYRAALAREGRAAEALAERASAPGTAVPAST